MNKVVPFQRWHLLSAFDEKDAGTGMTIPFEKYATILEAGGFAFTAINEAGRVIACGGVFPFTSGMAEAWSFLSDEVKQKPYFLVKAVKRVLREMQERGFRRIQVNVLSRDCKWARVLGFRHEGPVHAFGANGEDYERWAIWQD